jgi:hypothetical protein
MIDVPVEMNKDQTGFFQLVPHLANALDQVVHIGINPAFQWSSNAKRSASSPQMVS